MDISAFKRDASVIEDGKWVGEIPGYGDVKLRVRGRSSRAFDSAYSQLLRDLPRHDRERDGMTPTPEARDRCFALALHAAVLIDWDGISDNGARVPYEKELAARWLTDPDYEPFRDAVSWAAGVVDNEAAAINEAIEKN